MLSLNTDKGFAPLSTGHEPVMLLLHQSAYNICKKKKTTQIIITCFIKPQSQELNEKSPVQVSHLLLPITKRLHYFYANRAVIFDTNTKVSNIVYELLIYDKCII